MTMPTEDELLNEMLFKDKAAIGFCKAIFRISQVLDDLIDKDKPLTDEEVIKSFWAALVWLPQNPFYLENMHTLVPMLQVFMQDWVDSTQLEKGDEADQNAAFILRDSISGLLIHVMHIVGGYEWAMDNSAAVRRYIYEDTLEDYRKGLQS